MSKKITKAFRLELLNSIITTLDGAETVEVEWRRNTVDLEPYPGGFRRTGPGDRITMFMEFTMKPPRKGKRKKKPVFPAPRGKANK